MIMPIGDDNLTAGRAGREYRHHHREHPGVRAFFQDGENEKFTYSFSTVPAKLSLATTSSPTPVK